MAREDFCNLLSYPTRGRSKGRSPVIASGGTSRHPMRGGVERCHEVHPSIARARIRPSLSAPSIAARSSARSICRLPVAPPQAYASQPLAPSHPYADPEELLRCELLRSSHQRELQRCQCEVAEPHVCHDRLWTRNNLIAWRDTSIVDVADVAEFLKAQLSGLHPGHKCKNPAFDTRTCSDQRPRRARSAALPAPLRQPARQPAAKCTNGLES